MYVGLSAHGVARAAGSSSSRLLAVAAALTVLTPRGVGTARRRQAVNGHRAADGRRRDRHRLEGQTRCPIRRRAHPVAQRRDGPAVARTAQRWGGPLPVRATSNRAPTSSSCSRPRTRCSRSAISSASLAGGSSDDARATGREVAVVRRFLRQRGGRGDRCRLDARSHGCWLQRESGKCSVGPDAHHVRRAGSPADEPGRPSPPRVVRSLRVANRSTCWIGCPPSSGIAASPAPRS